MPGPGLSDTSTFKAHRHRDLRILRLPPEKIFEKCDLAIPSSRSVFISHAKGSSRYEHSGKKPCWLPCAYAVQYEEAGVGVEWASGPAFSKTGVISAENMNHSNHLDARDQLKQAFWDVRLMGRMGSNHSSTTNLGGVDGLTGGRWEAIAEWP